MSSFFFFKGVTGSFIFFGIIKIGLSLLFKTDVLLPPIVLGIALGFTLAAMTEHVSETDSN